MRRRAHLKLIGAALALHLSGCDAPADEACTPGDVGPPLALGEEPAHVEEIAAWILSVADADLVPDLRARLASDWALDDVFAGLLLASARHIDSKYGGGGFHFVIMVAALRHFAARVPEEQSLVPLVFGMLRTRSSIAATPWSLPPVDPSAIPSPGDATRFREAVVAGDTDAAMREIVALVRSGDARSTRDAMLELGARRAFQLGHEAIAVAKVTPFLSELPGAWTEDVWRALAFMITSLDKTPVALDDHADAWATSRARAVEVPCGWLRGEDAPTAVPEIAAALRLLSDPLDAIDVVAARLNEGVSPTTLWDAIVLAAADRAYDSGDVHALTAPQALRDAYLLAGSERVRLTLLFQGAAFGALAREPPTATVSGAMPIPSTLDDVFAESGRAAVDRALGYLLHGGDEVAYLDRVLRTNDVGTTDEHAYKSAHAAVFEADRLPAKWRPHLLAMCRLYAPSTSAPANQAWTSVMGA